jgi:acyl-CoA thioester hydrolase
MEAHCAYKAPVIYDDLIKIKTVLSEIGRSRITFEYEVIKGGKVATTGYTKHVFVNGTGKPIPVPDRVKKYLTK